MIESMCVCGAPLAAPEAKINTVLACKKCRAKLRPVSGEPLDSGAGVGDFDARLTVVQGPDAVGDQIFLGGVADIEIGKLPERHIVLGGTKVSRLHCKLSRVDFGPSRWKLVDNRSTNGVFVNGSRAKEYDLDANDDVTIGEYTLKYETDVAPPPPPAPKTVAAPQHAA
ncbi:MAG: FHA domain-containing protein, partial [Chthoniobacterales bacterium]|nr:FHA domain-containing protein [Chthoniobacterales bacterium]